MPIMQLPHPPLPRRLRAVALLAALALHVAALLIVPFPVRSPDDDVVTLLVPTSPEEIPPLLVAPRAPVTSEPAAAAAGDPSPGSGSESGPPGRPRAVAQSVAAAIPVLPDRGAAAETPGLTAMHETRAATLPLVVRPGGGIGGRSLGRTPEQLAIARAESLLVARLAGIAVVERRDTGTVGLANGGITLAIPWPGFLPANRGDEKWREERCGGSGDGDSDKAGEGEARGAQCD
jgi:hypothetical protein